jgi:hypothetical protein
MIKNKISRILSTVTLFCIIITVSSQGFALTTKQIWDYQNLYKHKEAAKIIGKEFNKLLAQYKVAKATDKPALSSKLLESFYNLGWCQLSGRLYDDNIKAYIQLLSIKLPLSKLKGKSVWTVRSGFAIGARLAVKGKYKMALMWINWAESLYKLHPYQKRNKKTVNPFKVYYNNGYDFFGFKTFIKKKMKLGSKKAKYTMKVLSIIYPNVDYTAYQSAGVKKGKHKYSYTWNKDDYANLAVSQGMMKLAIEALSNGNLSLKFQDVKVKGKIYENPKKESGYLYTRAIKKEKNLLVFGNPHDFTMQHILSNDAGATGHGGGSSIILYALPDSAAHWTTLVHEFFHCVESHFGWGPHLYRTKNAAPGWNGILWDQMDYYGWRFKTGILKMVKKDTAKFKYSGWISQFNWGPASLRKSVKATKLMPPTAKLP